MSTKTNTMKYEFLSKLLFFLGLILFVSCSTSDELTEEDIEEEIIFEPREARELDQIVSVLEEDDDNLDPNFNWIDPRLHWVYANKESFDPTDGARISMPYYDGQSVLNRPGREDKPEDGWVLVAKDFGTEERARKGLPFFALYNTESGLFRFMFYNLFAYRMSEARVTLGFLDPKKSGGLLHGMDERENLPDHVKYDRYFEATAITKFDVTGGWGVANFELQFDPELHRETILDFNIFFATTWITTSQDEDTGEVIETITKEEVEKYQHVRLSVFDESWLNDGTTYKNLYSGSLGI
jgi:hypothetical protein